MLRLMLKVRQYGMRQTEVSRNIAKQASLLRVQVVNFRKAYCVTRGMYSWTPATIGDLRSDLQVILRTTEGMKSHVRTHFGDRSPMLRELEHVADQVHAWLHRELSFFKATKQRSSAELHVIMSEAIVLAQKLIENTR